MSDCMRILIRRSRPRGDVSKDGTAHGWFFSSLLVVPDRAVGGSEEKVDRHLVVAEGQQDATKKQGAAVAKDQLFLGQDRGALRKRLAVLAHGLVQERQRPIDLSAKEDTGVSAE